MAFNPTGYQTLYGFSMLDELHNFFPEVLYDDQTFPQEPWLWMRHRIRTLFPHVFVRQQNLYSIYHATERRTTYNAWRNTLPRPVPREVNVVPIVQTPIDIPVTPARAPRSVIAPIGPGRRRTRPATDDIGTLGLSAIFLDGLLNNNNTNALFNWIPQDVPVVPTTQQIETGTVVVPYEDVPDDVTCAVCQEHGLENDVWRRLHCNHHFHSRCILPWFERNVHCPVCRADIRDAPVSVD